MEKKLKESLIKQNQRWEKDRERQIKARKREISEIEKVKKIKQEIKEILLKVKKEEKSAKFLRLIFDIKYKIINLEMDKLIFQKDAENLWILIEKVEKCFRNRQEIEWLDGRKI